MLAAEMLQAHGAGEHHDLERELVGPEVVVEEVHREQEHDRQERLLAVEDGGDVEHPARQELARQGRQPHHQAADADDRDAPERRPVVELLPVGPAVEHRPRALADEPLEHGDDVFHVLPVRDQRVRAEPAEGLAVAPDAQRDVAQVPEEDAGEDHRTDAVDRAGHRGTTQAAHTL